MPKFSTGQDTPERDDVARSAEVERVRQQLRGVRGAELWRSLDELAQTPEFEDLLHREFPQQASELPEGVDRRRFLQLAAASLAFGGLTACTRQPIEKIVPYIDQPESLIPGKPLFFASAMPLDGFAKPVLIESHMGRPTKVEGNPQHPASGGAADLYTQASILDMYDPERSQVVKNLGRIRTWDAFNTEIQAALQSLSALGDVRLRLLTHTVTSPSLGAVIDELLSSHPQARWHQYTPVTRDHQRLGLQRLFSAPVEPLYHLDKANVVLALDSDFLTMGPGSVAYARQFAERRRVSEEKTDMSRLYAVESSPTATGTLADHRLTASSRQIAALAATLAARLGVQGAATADDLDAHAQEWVAAVAEDLAANGDRALVICGEYAAPGVHTLAHAMNAALGSIGQTIDYIEPIEHRWEIETDSLRSLARDMEAGQVDLLLILGCNPVFDAPADLRFMQAMENVSRRIHLGLYENETSEFCHWHLPEAHFLESWGDARAYDGSVCFTQPLIEPLYGGRTNAEVVSAFTSKGSRSALELVQGYWRGQVGAADFDAAWRSWLHDGFKPHTPPSGVTVSADPQAVTEACKQAAAATGNGSSELEVVFRPDPTIYDGRYINNGWLQECPKPLTKLTWDNALLVSPGTAERLGIRNAQMVAITAGDRVLEMPVWIQPGHPEQTLTAHFGYGRRTTGRVGSGAGFDAFQLRGSDSLWALRGATIHVGDGEHALSSTQMHSNIALEGIEAEKRHLVRVGTLHHFEQDPEFAQHMGHSPGPELSMFPMWEYPNEAWGLAIDLSACTGCNACVIACQAENNIPIVGKEQVALGREMHWIRIDRYFQGDLDDPQVHHQPVMCMHCEQAPCEPVCPVGATVHSDEGLNDMVYNRCVGTRYCSNNCPYKVRRFNFLRYNDTSTPVLEMLRNPDVTVRSRGVMEKCTYCVQRINQARITARTEDRPIQDGEIQTACQQTCPSVAIVFGDINDESSAVARMKSNPLNYGILEELGTRPRTTYLAKMRNPNPKLEKPSDDAH